MTLKREARVQYLDKAQMLGVLLPLTKQGEARKKKDMGR